MNWFKQLFSRRRLYNDLSEEIQAHLQEKIEELVASGMLRKEAAAAARREFGNVTLVEEDSRAVWQWPSVESFFADLRYGGRMLRKNPGFTAVAVVTLALGIGASTSVFSLINAVLIRSLPYKEPERLVYLWSPNPRFQLPVEYLTPMTADFFDLQKQNHSFASLALVGAARFNLASEGRADPVGGARVTGDFFRTMGISPVLGRTVDAKDDQPGQEQVAVISNRLWRAQFGAEPDTLNKFVLLDA